MQHLKNQKELKEEIRLCIQQSHEMGKKILEARRLGRRCAKRALWIPVTRWEHDHSCALPQLLTVANNRCVHDPVLHQHMVETKALYNTGLRTGAIEDDGVMVGVPLGWRLVAAPPPIDMSAYSLIFWEPAGEDDRTPLFEKVVGDFCNGMVQSNRMKMGACIHGAEKISPMLADPNADHVRLQCTSAVHNLKSVRRL